jgi:hypothetical protein
VEPGGEIVVQDSGGYSTGFTITKSVTIDAAGFNASVISTSATDLCTINAGALDRVVLRGISFHGARIGNNAIVAQVGSLFVEHCSISEFRAEGVYMPNGGNLSLTGTDVRGCGGAGVVVNASATTPAHLVAQDSRFTECGEGLTLRALLGTASASGLVTNCTAAFCAEGFSAVASTSRTNVDMTLTNCRAIGNGLGISASADSQNATIRIAGCVVVQNNTGIPTGFGGFVIGTSPGTNLIAGNIAGNALSGGGITLQ